MAHLSTSEARGNLSEIVNRVAYGGERVILHRRGRELAALVPMEDVARLQALEDADDVAVALEALAEPGAMPHEQVRRRLGL